MLIEAIASVSFCGVESYMFTVSDVATSHSTESRAILTFDPAAAFEIMNAEENTPCALRATSILMIQSEEDILI